MALTVIYTLLTLKSEYGLNPNMDSFYKRNCKWNLTIMQPIFIISSFILSICSVAASYGMTDTMGRMQSDAQFGGFSSVPAQVEMMGFLGIGNNPMVGCTVACAVDVCAVDVATALNK